MRSFFTELLKRRVLQTGLWYIGASVAILEAANVILPALDFSTAILRPITLLAVFGLPVALTLSWEFDVRSVRSRDPNRKMLRLIPVVVVAAFSVTGAWLVWQYRYGASAATPDPPVADADPAHVAVLPFKVATSDSALSAFAYSLQGLMIGGLAQAAAATAGQDKRLRVVSEAGIRPFSNGDVALDSLRRALKVGTVLDGSVESAGGAVRVRLSLVDTETGDQVATSVIEKRSRDRIQLADAVADSMLRLVRRELGTLVRSRARRLETNNVDAFNFYTAAMRRLADLLAVEKDSAAARAVLADADTFLAHAERLDPRWIEPIVQRGHIARMRFGLADRSDDPAAIANIAVGIRYADRALKLHPGDYRALELRGRLTYLRLKYDRRATDAQRAELAANAERDLLMALTANPNPALCYRILSELSWDTGRREQAVAYGKRAYDEDPYLEDLAPTLLRRFEYALAMNRDTEAEEACREGRTRFVEAIFDDCRLQLAAWSRYSMKPDSAYLVAKHELQTYDATVPRGLEARVVAMYAAILARNRMPDSARVVLASALRRSPDSVGTLRAAAGVYALLGAPDSAVLMVKKLLAVMPDQRGALKTAPELRLLQSNPAYLRLTEFVD